MRKSELWWRVMEGLIWEQKAWSEVTAWMERHMRAPGFTRAVCVHRGGGGHQGPQNARRGSLQRRVNPDDLITSMSCAPNPECKVLAGAFLLLGYITWIHSLSSTWPLLFSEANLSYIGPQWQNFWIYVLVREECDRGYGIIAATLALGGLIKEPSPFLKIN